MGLLVCGRVGVFLEDSDSSKGYPTLKSLFNQEWLAYSASSIDGKKLRFRRLIQILECLKFWFSSYNVSCSHCKHNCLITNTINIFYVTFLYPSSRVTVVFHRLCPDRACCGWRHFPFSWRYTLGWKSDSHALLAPDLSRQEITNRLSRLSEVLPSICLPHPVSVLRFPFSWSVTSGRKTASHALSAPDVSHQEITIGH